MAVNDIIRINVLQAFKGNRMISGFNLQIMTNAGSMSDATDDVVANILPTWIAAVTQDLGIVSVEVQDVVPGTKETQEHTITGNLVGQLVSPSAPPQVAAVLSIHTGMKGKRHRGRMYVGGLASEFVGAGTISGVQLTHLNDLANTLKNRYCVGGTARNTAYQMVVYSPADPTFVNKKGEHTRLDTIITPATLITVDPIARTQRRRELGVGA